jgi:hypothetical protein
MKPLLFPIALIVLISAVGCKKQSDLTLEEFVRVSGVQKWTFLVPDDLEDSEYLSLVWKKGEEKIENEFSFQGELYSSEIETYGWTHPGSADFLRFVVSNKDSKGAENGLTFHKFEPPEGYHFRGHGNAPEMKEGMVLMYFSNRDRDEIELVVERHKL